MEYIVGITLAVLVGIFAATVGFDRERNFYPVVLVVVAHYYLLFAATAYSTSALLAESLPALVFIVAAVLGFRRTAWFAVAGLAAHGVFDFFHGAVIANPGVPAFWPGFCMAYDVTAAAWLAGLMLWRRSPRSAQFARQVEAGPSGARSTT